MWNLQTESEEVYFKRLDQLSQQLLDDQRAASDAGMCMVEPRVEVRQPPEGWNCQVVISARVVRS